MIDLVSPKPEDFVVIYLTTGLKISGFVKFITDSSIILNPSREKYLAVIAFENILCYFIHNQDIENYLNQNKTKAPVIKESIAVDVDEEVKGRNNEDRIKSIVELRKEQKDLELENAKRLMTTFEPNNYGINYQLPLIKTKPGGL